MEKKNAITGIEKFDDTKNLIEMVDKFLNDINLRNDVMLMTYVIENSLSANAFRTSIISNIKDSVVWYIFADFYSLY